MILSRIKSGCRVGFFGLGGSNTALLSHLPLEKCRVSLRSDGKIDRNAIPKGIRVERILEGKNACQDINEDILFLSPSVRREREELCRARKNGVILTSDAELFFESNDRPIFAVTGSDGKSTTATLISLLLKEGGYNAPLVGNIGEPFINGLGRNADAFVCELSSFMLAYYTPKSKAACITNVTPNHLDWHSDFEEYRKTKLSLAEKTDRLIISDVIGGLKQSYGVISGEREFWELKSLYSSAIYLTLEKKSICKNGTPLINISKIRRKEKHNILNLMMAIAMTDSLVGSDEIIGVAEGFTGLKHRCEWVLNNDGIDYYDSSIDSTPARTAQTLRSLDRSVVIILGGRGKGLDYDELIPEMKKYVKAAIITGENAEEIYETVKGFVDAEIVDNFDRAVKRGQSISKDVGTLLLSPASTSFDRFKNYAERGYRFKQILLKNGSFDNISLQNTGRNEKKT